MDTSIWSPTSPASIRLHQPSPSPRTSLEWHRLSGPVSSRYCQSTSNRLVAFELSILTPYSQSPRSARRSAWLADTARSASRLDFSAHCRIQERFRRFIAFREIVSLDFCYSSRSQLTSTIQAREARIADRAKSKGERRPGDSDIGDCPSRTTADPTIPMAIRGNEEHE